MFRQQYHSVLAVFFFFFHFSPHVLLFAKANENSDSNPTEQYHIDDRIDTYHNFAMNNHETSWTVYVSTSRHAGAGTDSLISVILHGQLSSTLQLPLTSDDPYPFHEGALSKFKVLTVQIGEPLYAVTLDTTDMSAPWGRWHCNKVEIHNHNSGAAYEILVNDWLGHDMHKYNVSLVKPVGRSLNANIFMCFICNKIVEIAVDEFNDGKDAISDQLSVYCDALAFLKNLCKKIVRNVLELIVQLLEEHVEPKKICVIVKMCYGAKKAPHILTSADLNIFSSYVQNQAPLFPVIQAISPAPID